MKCDIEGAERELFARCRPWIHRVRNLLIEIHGDYTADVLLKDLIANGAFFDTEILGSGESYSLLLMRNRRLVIEGPKKCCPRQSPGLLADAVPTGRGVRD